MIYVQADNRHYYADPILCGKGWMLKWTGTDWVLSTKTNMRHVRRGEYSKWTRWRSTQENREQVFMPQDGKLVECNVNIVDIVKQIPTKFILKEEGHFTQGMLGPFDTTIAFEWEFDVMKLISYYSGEEFHPWFAGMSSRSMKQLINNQSKKQLKKGLMALEGPELLKKIWIPKFVPYRTRKGGK